jgi:hypothetical protein
MPSVPRRPKAQQLPTPSNKEFLGKAPAVQRQIVEALSIIQSFGIPLDGHSPRGLERVALVFLAVADLRPGAPWRAAKDASSGRSLKSRDIIDFLNSHYGERISSGSYDDIRRRDLLHLVQAGVVVQTSPNAARNSPTRGYALDRTFAGLVRDRRKPGWEAAVAAHLAVVGSLVDRLNTARAIPMMPVTLPGGRLLELSPGEHNALQAAVIQEFLPRFGHRSELLYLGDAANKSLHIDVDRLRELRFFDLDHAELPDVVAYAPSENWLYLIEAVHSFGPITPSRKLKLQDAAKGCTAELLFVTAFQDRATFRKFVADLAWEQEVWIADEPDHMIHFNGDKFLGPHIKHGQRGTAGTKLD